MDLNGGKSSDKRKHHDETESYKDVKRVRTVYWFLSFFLPSFLFPFCLLSLVAAAVKAVKSRERLREEEQKKIKPKKTIITNNSSYNNINGMAATKCCFSLFVAEQPVLDRVLRTELMIGSK